MGNIGSGRLRPVILCTFVAIAGLTRPVSADPVASGTDGAAALWTVLAGYDEVRSAADADFAKRIAPAVEKRNAAFDRAYAEYARNPDPAKARVAYNKWIAEAQQALARQVAPAGGAWLTRMRDFRSHTAEPALARAAAASRGRDDASVRLARLVDRARTGFTHRWTSDADAFNGRVRQLTDFRPAEPADVATLRAAQPAIFDVPSAGPATEPTTRPALRVPEGPVDAILWVLDDDNQAGSKLYLNGEEPIPADHVKRTRVSDFLTRYDFRLLPTDVLAVTSTDRKTGAMAFLMTDADGHLIAYSHAGLPTSMAPAAHELAQVARVRADGPWEPAARVPKDTRPIRSAASVPGSLPADFSGIWLSSSKTGRCTVLVSPVSP